MFKLSKSLPNYHLLLVNDPPLLKEYKMIINVNVSDSVSFPVSVYYLGSATKGFQLPKDVLNYLVEHNAPYDHLLTNTTNKGILVADAYPIIGCKNIMYFTALLTYDINIIAESRTKALEEVAVTYRRSNIHRYIEAIENHGNHVDISFEFVNEPPNKVFLSELSVA